MSVLTRVEAASTKGRIFLAGVTLVLTLGGVTMVYPFILMLAGSMRSQMDSSDMGPIPTYFNSFQELLGKFAETKYEYDPELMNRFRQSQVYDFRQVDVPAVVDSRAIEDYERFVRARALPDHWFFLGGTAIHSLITGDVYREFARRVRDRYDDDLHALNLDLGSPLAAWGQLSLPPPDWMRSGFTYEPSPVYEEYFRLVRERPLAEIALQNLSGFYLERIVYPRYGRRDVAALNEAYGLALASHGEFALPQRVPEAPEKAREEWIEFVFQDHLNLSFVRSDAADEAYRTFLQERYRTIEDLRRYWPDAGYAAFDEIRLPADDAWIPEFRRRDYGAFLQTLPPERLRLVGPEFAWRDFLRERYRSVEAINAAWAGTPVADWSGARIPLRELEKQYVTAHSAALRRTLATRNFSVVFNQVFVQGRAFMNSMIYVGLALFFSLTLQPMVAYSLSRFNPPGTWKIIFLFVATMAFPPMVSLIPQFLIIQRLNLLNTFFALVLPVIINGYLIFLLKGFFDSIPQDLYDAAQIDGASELHMFWHITMALSYPILAVVALGTFNSAWMAFMYPLIVCPDERMHVLAVWLHQFQRQAPTPAVFASILIASVPSLVIFIFAQRTIMRGIAVPAEK